MLKRSVLLDCLSDFRNAEDTARQILMGSLSRGTPYIVPDRETGELISARLVRVMFPSLMFSCYDTFNDFTVSIEVFLEHNPNALRDEYTPNRIPASQQMLVVS